VGTVCISLLIAEGWKLRAPELQPEKTNKMVVVVLISSNWHSVIDVGLRGWARSALKRSCESFLSRLRVSTLGTDEVLHIL
jgi:hypothetical protein